MARTKWSDGMGGDGIDGAGARRWIVRVLAERGWTPTDLAERAGIAPSTMLRALSERTDFAPSVDTMGKVATAATIPLPVQVRALLDARAPVWAIPGGDPIPYWGADTPTVPFRVVRSVATDRYVERWPPGRHARRPDALRDDRTAFAFEVPDATMKPWLQAGTLALGSHARAPVPDDLVLVTDRDDVSAVRLVRGLDADGIRLATTDPRDAYLMWFGDLSDVAVVRATTRG